MVAKAFIPNPNGYDCVNHKDENPSNNRADNLEWCTHKYNVRYSYEKHKSERFSHIKNLRRKGAIVKPYKYTKEVIQKTLDGKYVCTHTTLADVVRNTGYNNYAITECCKGKRKSAYGYKWEFAE